MTANHESPNARPESEASRQDAFLRQAEVVRALAASRFDRHFLERFLEGAGRPVHLPWWAVHALFYGLTVAFFVKLGHVQTQFPRGGYWSLLGFAAEFLATTYVLWHIRHCRAQVYLVAARMESGKHRLAWLRRYWGPVHWGWALPLNRGAADLADDCGEAPARERPVGAPGLQLGESGPSPGSGSECRPAAPSRRWWEFPLNPLNPRHHPPREPNANSGACGSTPSRRPFHLPVWGGTAVLLGLFYACLLWSPWPAGPFGQRQLRFPHELCLYTDLARTAMTVAVFSYCWTLAGLMAVVRGRYPTSMNPRQRRLLLDDCRRSALRLSLVIGGAIGLWLFAHGLDHGFTRWSWCWCVGLAALFVTQTLILGGPRAPGRHPFRSIVPLLSRRAAAADAPFRIWSPAEVLGALASFSSPVLLNALGSVAGGRWHF